MPRDGGTRFELLAEPANVYVDGPAAADPVVAPDIREELFACEHLAGVLREEEEQVELLRFEHALLAVFQNAATTRVELECAGCDAATVGVVAVRDTPEERADSCEQLAQSERLRQVIVGAHLE